jgi:hypothetical protein
VHECVLKHNSTYNRFLSEFKQSISKNKSECRKKLIIVAALSLIPIIAKGTFSIFPLLEARIMPFDLYAAIQRDFWLPFAVLFFAFASHLVPSRYRRGILIIVVMLVLVVSQQSSWNLGKPDMYDYKGTDLQKLSKPFLAGIKFSSRTNHMICVLEKTQEYLVVGDPISVGQKKWSWKNFSKMWPGIVIICN